MKKLILIFALFFVCLAHAQKPKVDYQRWKKYTTAEKLAIDVSDTTVVYELYDTDLQRYEHHNSDIGSWQPNSFNFTPTDLLTDYGFTDNSTNWNTAFGWGNHASAGYGLLSGTQTWTGLNTWSGGNSFTSEILVDIQSSGFGITINKGPSSSTYAFTIQDDGVTTASITKQGDIVANSVDIGGDGLEVMLNNGTTTPFSGATPFIDSSGFAQSADFYSYLDFRLLDDGLGRFDLRTDSGTGQDFSRFYNDLNTISLTNYKTGKFGLVGVHDGIFEVEQSNSTGSIVSTLKFENPTASSDFFVPNKVTPGTYFFTTTDQIADVPANTAARHTAASVLDSVELDFTLTGQQITGSIIAGSIELSKLSSALQTTIAKIDANESAIVVHEGRLDVLEASTISTTPRNVTSTTGVFTEAYNAAQPNARLNVTENTNISITGMTTKDAVIFSAEETGGTERLLQLIGTNDTLRAYIKSELIYFVAVKDTLQGVVWQRTYKDGKTNKVRSVTGTGTTSYIKWNESPFWVLNLTANETVIFDNPESSMDLTLEVRQDATGSRLLAFGNGLYAPSGTLPTLTTTANGIDVINLFYDKENNRYRIDNHELDYQFVAGTLDLEAPTSPSSLVASNATTTTIDLDWVASTDNVAVTGYRIYDSGVLLEEIGDVITYTLTGLTSGTEYNLTVRAFDAADNESADSNVEVISTTSTAPTPILDYMPSSIDATATVEGNDVNTWDDLSASNIDATSAGAADPVLNIDPNSTRQVRFNGTSTWMNLGNPSALNFVPGTNSFSIVVKIGETIGTATGYFIGKATTTIVTRQYGLYRNGATEIGVILRGVSYTASVALQPNDLIIFTANATTFDLWVNDTLLIDNQTISTANTSFTGANVNIGARTDGGGAFLNGDIELIKVYNTELTSDEINYLKTTYQEN